MLESDPVDKKFSQPDASMLSCEKNGMMGLD